MIDAIKDYIKQEIEESIPDTNVTSIDMARSDNNFLMVKFISFLYKDKPMSIDFKNDLNGDLDILINLIKKQINNN